METGRDRFAIAKRFKALRRKSVMSQDQLGRVIGICRQAVNRIENGHVTPHYTTFDRFCKLEAKHEKARAVTRALATEFGPGTRNITKGDNLHSFSASYTPRARSASRCA
jgi:DNA-binding XRE family transcriptional regulator